MTKRKILDILRAAKSRVSSNKHQALLIRRILSSRRIRLKSLCQRDCVRPQQDGSKSRILLVTRLLAFSRMDRKSVRLWERVLGATAVYFSEAKTKRTCPTEVRRSSSNQIVSKRVSLFRISLIRKLVKLLTTWRSSLGFCSIWIRNSSSPRGAMVRKAWWAACLATTMDSSSWLAPPLTRTKKRAYRRSWWETRL